MRATQVDPPCPGYGIDGTARRTSVDDSLGTVEGDVHGPTGNGGARLTR